MKKKRSELPDSAFGIPELRKYPMQDREHTLSAIKFFNYVDEEHEKELAKNIIKNMKKYDIPFDTVGEKNRLRQYIPEKYLEEAYLEEQLNKSKHKVIAGAVWQSKIRKYNKAQGIDIHDMATYIKHHGINPGWVHLVENDTDIEWLKYLKVDTRSSISTVRTIGDRIDKCNDLGLCPATKPYYKGINKLYISKGITSKDCELTLQGIEKSIEIIDKRIKELKKSGVKEDATANAMVGTNQPDSVYIVNYMKRNSFSGELEEHKGVCKSNMKNIHIFNKAKKKMTPVSLDEFTSIIEGDIVLTKLQYADFMNIIENAISESDIDYLASSATDYTTESAYIDNPQVGPNLIQEMQIYIDAERQLLDAHRYEHLCEIPVIESYGVGNHCNYYTDINGYFIKNEMTGLRSASYEFMESIPKAVIDRIRLS